MNARQTIELNITQGRRVLAEARQLLTRLAENTAFTPEYKETAAAALREQTLAAVQQGLENARATVLAAERAAQQARERLTAVDETTMAARAQLLAPLLNAAGTRPAALIDAYRHRFEQPVDRRILEEAIGAALDSAEPALRLHLQELFRQARQDTAARKSPEEQQADAAVAAAHDLLGYVEHWSTVLQAETKESLGLPLTSLEAVAHANAAAAVANFTPAS